MQWAGEGQEGTWKDVIIGSEISLGQERLCHLKPTRSNPPPPEPSGGGGVYLPLPPALGAGILHISQHTGERVNLGVDAGGAVGPWV